ncbi:MAG: AAA domain-containing protein [Saprospiraceae bacterium]
MSDPLAPLFYKQILKTAAHPDWAAEQQVMALADLLERLFLEITRVEQLGFNTLFARISYAGHVHQFNPGTLEAVHGFRRQVQRIRKQRSQASDSDVRLGVKALAETLLLVYKTAIPEELLPYFPKEGEWRYEAPENWEYKASARVVALKDLPEKQALLAVDEEDPCREIYIRYGLPARNDNFDPSIQLLRKVFGFPMSMVLLEVEIDAQGAYRPRVFVFEPDFLVDVSAISECFKDHGSEPFYHLVKKFLPFQQTQPILLGNIANFFLDRLLNEPEAKYSDLFRETFRVFPFAYAPMADSEVRSLNGKAQKHFLHLKNMASGGFEQQEIFPEDSILEPTFYSAQYGIQGRLDLFYKKEDKAAIVELKSGQPYRPNSYGIQRSHFTQTLLYDLLVRSVFGAGLDPVKYILYSGADLNQLRFAPTVAPEQWEALQVRNQLIALERLLQDIVPGIEQVPVFSRLSSKNGQGKGFLQRDFTLFESTFSGLDALERKYFNAFAGFIARENALAKIGEPGNDRAHGNAALWRLDYTEKQESFALLSHLELLENRADAPEPEMVFKKTEQTNPLANFRVGDIAVLYGANSEEDTVLDSQVLKCTITELSPDRVVVQPRYQQFNKKPFENARYWNLEPDMLETGFVAMYRSLFEWASCAPNKRRQLLHPPAISCEKRTGPLTVETIVNSPDFFLLWGPPGTGKTSVMLRGISEWILNRTEDNLLLLAYTNRAVDELCEALDSLGGNIRGQYLRIGSVHATSERFRGQLLKTHVSKVESRAELREVLESRRIFVGTVASFSQNDALLQLKKIQRVVIDEASQLLEPQLLGLLSRFEHFILIGDHRQLPAVTSQQADKTRVEDPDLNSIGLRDLRDSYFERLYRLCVENNWHEHFGQLNRQGRMHEEIMAFPNRHFYDGMLQTLGPELDPREWQKQDSEYVIPEALQAQSYYSDHRVLFIPAEEPSALPGQKTSRAEAERVVEAVRYFQELYAANGKAWDPLVSMGVITPWRAQIAQVRACMSEAGLDPDCITIDTVERYQGGAREVIVLSCCVHSEYQLASLVNQSTEGVDRKLNVALTRARQHLLVIGNPEILIRDPHYADFMEQYSLSEQTLRKE